jgi:hypothetical protein
MAAAANTIPGPSAANPIDSMNPPSPSQSASAADRQRKEERLIALYMDLTGASEATARSVYMHLGLDRQGPSPGEKG